MTPTAPRQLPTRPSDQQGVVTFDILTDNRVVSEAYQVLSLSVAHEVNRVPTARLVLRDGDAAAETFAISDTDDFLPGKNIHIKVGRDRDNHTLFRGIITKHGVRVRENGYSELTVECRDAAVRMTIGRHSRYFTQKKDSDVAADLIRPYPGLTANAEATTHVHAELVQHHATDWDFLLSRAEANGQLVVVTDGTVALQRPNTTATPALMLLFGSTLLEFEAEMDARTQWKAVKARAWNYSNQQLTEIQTDSSPVREPGNVPGKTLAGAINLPFLELRHSGHLLPEELQQWTEATMLRSRLAKNCGRAKVAGVDTIRPGQVVGLQGVGNRFNGPAFVSAVRHDVGGGKWDTHVQFGLSPSPIARQADFTDVPAGGLLPSVPGLQVGKVVQLGNDPNGEDRILVRLPVIDNNAPGIWARVASLDAGQNRGAFFRPEIDDEVIVGFINDDPRDAIVLGMLHSRSHPAPIAAQDTNHEKGFTTRSGMRLHFNDDSQTITLDTPGKHSIVIDDRSQRITLTDSNQNSIEMAPTGITIKSATNLTLQAGAQLQLAATTGLSIGGATVSMEAKGPVSVQGATAKLATPGVLELTGSFVKIN